MRPRLRRLLSLVARPATPPPAPQGDQPSAPQGDQPSAPSPPDPARREFDRRLNEARTRLKQTTPQHDESDGAA
jgi:hypothetical protein